MLEEREIEIKNIACESLEEIQNIYFSVINKLDNKNISSTSLSSEHSLNNPQPRANLKNIERELQEKYIKLKDEPLLARITVVNIDNDTENTYYINRYMPLQESISRNAPLGRLAAHSVGEEVDLGHLGSFEILEKIIYHTKYNGKWDSIDTIIEHEIEDTITLSSLRDYCNKKEIDIEDILSSFLDSEESEKLISKGIKRNIIRSMSLKDQPILDKFQDEIFRLPLQENLLILGSPGTGKTTTLIKRLGQKIDRFGLNDDEKELLKDFPTTLSLQDSWLMFTPTELLKHYVKEAFNKEGIPAHNNNIKTWSDYRLFLSREILDILKSAIGNSPFILNDDISTLNDKAFIETIELYEEFTLFFHQQLKRDLAKSNQWLLEHITDTNLIESNQFINDILNNTNTLTVNYLRSIDRRGKEFSEQIKIYQDDVSKIIESSLSSIIKKDKNFLNDLKSFIQTIKAPIEESIEDDESNDRLSKSEVTKAYSLAIRAYSRVKNSNKILAPTSKNSKIIEWLDDRLIDDNKISNLGEKLNILTHLRKFLNPMKLYINNIPSQYKKFRARKENNHWYSIDKKSQNILHSLEVDIILLLTLKNINAIRKIIPIGEIEKANYLSSFQPLFQEYRNQILVDEATDFSPIQLACMLELTNQKIQSFFACGDFNQRITTFGTQTEDDMRWVSDRFDIREIHNPYRQSKVLTNLAKAIVNEEFEDNIDNEEIAPILIENISDIKKLSLWLRDRIDEIEKMIRLLPSIAIFVNSREEVDLLTDALADVMVNIPVKGYRDGQGIGNEGTIRVFDIQHIKGLEFEAVFFINIDKLAEEKPLLFDKYLYVGVTRATTYLGITCEKSLPSQIEHTRSMFIDNWDK